MQDGDCLLGADHWIGTYLGGSMSSPDEDEVHRGLLLEAQGQYKELYVKQELLLASGEFSNRVAAALARMPCVKSLAFTDRLATTRRPAGAWNSPVRFGVDVRDAYYQAMREGMEGKESWIIQEGARRRFKFSQSNIYTIIVQLPIAIYRAGVPLDHLLFDLNGLKWDKDLKADSETLLALSSAVQSLKSIAYYGSIDLNKDLIRPEPVDDLSAFLGHLIKNPNLETINLDICGISRGNYSLVKPYTTTNEWARLPVSCSALSSNLPRNRLTNLRLSQVDFPREQLLSLLTSLPSRMEHLHLEGIKLVGGNWEDILDLIRMKTFADKDSLRLGNLLGGEYDNIRRINLNDLVAWRDREAHRTVLELYCLRLNQRNPLRMLRERNWSLSSYLGGLYRDDNGLYY